jgi:hypothetical protein
MKKKMKRFEEGGYTGDDEIVKYRMGMIDDKGNDLTKKSEPEFETKQGKNPNISDETRERAMASVASKSETTKPAAKVSKPTVKAVEKAATKTSTPKSQPESDREENSAWMREFRNKEAASAAKAKSEKTGFQLKKEKALGMKMGGKVSSASSRADGCAVKGKTKGRMI